MLDRAQPRGRRSEWSLLILREAFWGRTRFAEIRARLGVAPDVLTDRLGRLVDGGILERRPYRDSGEREREEYVLTGAGRALSRTRRDVRLG